MSMSFSRSLSLLLVPVAIAGCTVAEGASGEAPAAGSSATSTALQPVNACPFRSVTATTETSTVTLTATGGDEFVLAYSGGNYTAGTELFVAEPPTTWRGRCDVVSYGGREFHSLVFRCVDGHSEWVGSDGTRYAAACPGPDADPRIHELQAPFEVTDVEGRLTVAAQLPEPSTVLFPLYFPHVGKAPFIGH